MVAENPEARLRYDRAPDRRDQILGHLRSTGFCSITDLAADLGVSDMTIRRDLRRLSAAGEVRVVHGGVSLPHATLRTSEFVSRARSQAESKRQIALAAAARVRPSDAVAIDAGTTTFDVAVSLPDDFMGSVVTHSVPVIQHLLNLPGVRVVGLGGDLYPPSQAFVGPATAEQAAHLRVRTFFLGAAAVDARGVYVEADVERSTKLALMDAADEIVLCVDHSKFSRSAAVRLCSLDRLTALVCDLAPPDRVRGQLDRFGVELVVATPTDG
jgi:DeoR/GlpR family transcriptional regulator of sugar metabolism